MPKWCGNGARKNEKNPLRQQRRLTRTIEKDHLQSCVSFLHTHLCFSTQVSLQNNEVNKYAGIYT